MSVSFFRKNLERGTIVELVMLGAVLTISIFLLVMTLKNSPKQEPLANQNLMVERERIVPKVPAIIYNLTGSIKDLQFNSMLFLADMQAVEGDQIVQTKMEKKVLLTDETKFSQLKIIIDKKTGAQSIQEIKISRQDLQKGAQAEVIAKENIKEALEFSASQVRLLPVVK